jgi:hypothetical protein
VVLFDTDDDFTGERRRRIRLNLRPTPKGTDGDRWRKVKVDQFSERERRAWALSWHGFYVFMAAVLELDPEAEFKTALAHWKGREDFHDRAPMTANTNWGSLYMPQYAGEMADYRPTVGDMRRLACEIAGTEPSCEPDDRMIRFSTLYPDGTEANVRTLPQSKIAACPHFIMAIEHYRADGTCKCNDPAENVMAEWEYTWNEQEGRWT